MPIEVKELVMRINIPANNGASDNDSCCGSNSSSDMDNDSSGVSNMSGIVSACVNQVLMILERNKER